MTDRKMTDRKIRTVSGRSLFFCLSFFCPLSVREEEK